MVSTLSDNNEPGIKAIYWTQDVFPSPLHHLQLQRAREEETCKRVGLLIGISH